MRLPGMAIRYVTRIMLTVRAAGEALRGRHSNAVILRKLQIRVREQSPSHPIFPPNATPEMFYVPESNATRLHH